MRLCVDVGSSSVKASLICRRGTQRTAACATVLGDDGQFDVVRITEAVNEVIQRVAASSELVTDIVFTTFVQAYVALDAGGRVVAVASYARHGETFTQTASALRNLCDADGLHDVCGAPIHPAYLSVQSQNRNVDFIHGWCSLGSYLLSSILNRDDTLSLGVSVSEAAWSGLLDGRADNRYVLWSGDALQVAGLQAAQCSEPILTPVHGSAQHDVSQPVPLLPNIKTGSFCMHVGGPHGDSKFRTCPLVSLLGPSFAPSVGVRVWLAVGDGAGAALGSGCLPIPSALAGQTSVAGVPAAHVLALTVGTSAALRTVITAAHAERVFCRRQCSSWPREQEPSSPTAASCTVCGRLRLSALGLWAYPISDVDLDHLLSSSADGAPLLPSSTSGGYVLVGGALTDGGNIMDVFRRQHGVGPAQVDTFGLYDTVLPSPLSCLPFFSGERSTGWRSGATATYTGMSAGTSPVDTLRAAMDGVAFRLRAIYDALLLVLGACLPLVLEEDTHSAGTGRSTRVHEKPNTRVVCSGGSLHANTTWCKIISEALVEPLYVPSAAPDHDTPIPSADATTIGAVLLSQIHWAANERCKAEERQQLVAEVCAHTQQLRDMSPERWRVFRPSTDASVRAQWMNAQGRHTALYEAMRTVGS